jgi:hypothetical protein
MVQMELISNEQIGAMFPSNVLMSNFFGIGILVDSLLGTMFYERPALKAVTAKLSASFPCP